MSSPVYEADTQGALVMVVPWWRTAAQLGFMVVEVGFEWLSRRPEVVI